MNTERQPEKVYRAATADDVDYESAYVGVDDGAVSPGLHPQLLLKFLRRTTDERDEVSLGW
jgi:hypothetical protein